MKAKAVYAVAKDTVELREFDIDESQLEPNGVLGAAVHEGARDLRPRLWGTHAGIAARR